MKIAELYSRQKHTFSFEFFPPKTEEGEIKLFETITRLKNLKPSFCSITYGAMGTTRTNTLKICKKIKKEFDLETTHHLTCVGHNREEMKDILMEIKDSGIENIIVLRGDPPKGETEFKPVPNGFRYGSELVNFIRQQPELKSAFSLAVAGYPEGHLECPDKEQDLKHLKEKVDQGADVVITQLFFDNRDFFDFMERCRKIGIKIPIVPGIMPVANGPQIQRITSMCGARIPKRMQQTIDQYGEDHASVEAFGVEFATEQCRELLKHKVPGIHFYTLNKSNPTEHIYQNLGLSNGRVN